MEMTNAGVDAQICQFNSAMRIDSEKAIGKVDESQVVLSMRQAEKRRRLSKFGKIKKR